MLFILSGNRLPALWATVFVLDEAGEYSDRQVPMECLQARLPRKRFNDPMIRIMRFVCTWSLHSFSQKKETCYVCVGAKETSKGWCCRQWFKSVNDRRVHRCRQDTRVLKAALLQELISSLCILPVTTPQGLGSLDVSMLIGEGTLAVHHVVTD